MQEDCRDDGAARTGLVAAQQPVFQIAQIAGGEFGIRPLTQVEPLRRRRHRDEFGAERSATGVPGVAGTARCAEHPPGTRGKCDGRLIAVRQHVQDLPVERKVIDAQIDRIEAGLDLDTDRIAFTQRRSAARQTRFHSGVGGERGRGHVVECQQ